MKEKFSEKYEAFKARNATYYKEAFSKMEQRKGYTFNWAACLLPPTVWMMYRRMWFSLMAYVAVSTVLSQVAFSICSANGLSGSEWICSLLLMAIMGFIGNSLYYMELQWKIKNGYHLKQDFSPTSMRCVVFIPIVIGIVNSIVAQVALTYTTAFPERGSLAFSIATSAIMICIYAVVCFWEYRRYRTAVIKTEKDSVKQYLDKKGDDISVIWGVVYFFVLFFFGVIVIVAGMKFVGKKITNQLNTIADEIDKNGGKTPQIPGNSNGVADGIAGQLDSIANDIDQMNGATPEAPSNEGNAGDNVSQQLDSIANDIDQMNGAQTAPVSQDVGNVNDASNDISGESPNTRFGNQ